MQSRRAECNSDATIIHEYKQHKYKVGMKSRRAECNSSASFINEYKQDKYKVWNLEGQNVTVVLVS